MIAVSFGLAPLSPPKTHARLLDLTPVFRNRAALGYVLGYGAPCFELTGVRTWIVPFGTFVAARSADNPLFTPITVSVVMTFLSLPSSIIGNEAALRFGRHRSITATMIMSGLVALAIGFSAGASLTWLLLLILLYAVTISADSGALTSGMMTSAIPEYLGATMALHSTVGFGLSAVGAWVTGSTLDAGGGPAAQSGW
jgi:hypothetical protein